MAKVLSLTVSGDAKMVGQDRTLKPAVFDGKMMVKLMVLGSFLKTSRSAAEIVSFFVVSRKKSLDRK